MSGLLDATPTGLLADLRVVAAALAGAFAAGLGLGVLLGRTVLAADPAELAALLATEGPVEAPVEPIPPLGPPA